MNKLLASIALTFALSVGTANDSLAAAVLYDSGLGSLPSSQGWAYLTNPFFGASATRSFSGGAAVLDTRPATSDSAGYFAQNGTHPKLPVLDRATGFTLDFSLQVQAENHNVSNRAGLSVLVVTQDLRALELAFWQNEVWAYADGATGGLFAHGEGAAFDTAAGVADYALNILGNGYTLSANGSPILTGLMRDYTAFSGTLNPYQTPNLIFIGDDTSSAASFSRLTYLAVMTVPAPPTWLLFVSGLWIVRRFRQKAGLWR